MIVEQCRSARALLGWSAQDLADAGGLGVATVRRYEAGAVVSPLSIAAMENALIKAGAVFIGDSEKSDSGGPGVRFAGSQEQITFKA